MRLALRMLINIFIMIDAQLDSIAPKMRDMPDFRNRFLFAQKELRNAISEFRAINDELGDAGIE